MKPILVMLALAFALLFITNVSAKKLPPDISRTVRGTSFCTPTHPGLYLEAGTGILFTTNKDTIFIEQNIRAASVAVTSGQTSVSVVFDSPLPDASYVLTLSPSEFAQVRWSSKTASGFTLNLASGINGNVDYLATPIP